jgi:hypothetical protein
MELPFILKCFELNRTLLRFVIMARKLLKLTRPKGERLGWTPLDQVKHITLTSVIVRGRRLSVRQRQQPDANAPKFLIP